VNRCGSAPYLSYAGDTMLVDWYGTVVSSAEGAEGMLTNPLDEAGLAEYRTALPFLKDMRPVAG
ncbi:MAG: carbon-nitrogen family hydrolase, partial [bacterium]